MIIDYKTYQPKKPMLVIHKKKEAVLEKKEE
jgi:hypothetical protein